MIADNFDRGLVGPHRAVGAHAPEFAAGGPGRRRIEVCRTLRQRRERDIVLDADGEAIARLIRFEVFVDGRHLRWRKIFRSQSVAAADNHRPASAAKGVPDIHVQGLARRARLFGPVQHGHFTGRRRDRPPQMFDGKRPEQVDVDQADFFTAGVQIVDRLPDDVTGRAHGDNDPFRVGGAIVVEQLIIASGKSVDLAHGFFDDVGQLQVKLVHRFAGLEINIRILRRPASHGVVRIQGPRAKRRDRLPVQQTRQFLVFQHFNLLGLVRSPEPVEEMQERNPARDGRQMRDRRQIHALLDIARGQEGKPGLPRGHDILVVAKDAEGIGGQRPRAYVENGGQQFAGDFVHVGDHQQKSLRGGVGSRQRTGLERSVQGAGRAAL